jgi:hypothetical protein
MFGKANLFEVPNEFTIAEPLKIKHQFSSDLCTAFASSSVSEDQEGVELSPEYIFAKTKQIMGSYKGYGADPISTCKAHVKKGAIEQLESPITLGGTDRNTVADWKWTYPLDSLAVKHRKGAFFEVDGYDSLFDSVRGTMWQNREEKRTVFAGVYWQPEWSRSNGMCEHYGQDRNSPHAIKVFGSKVIDGKVYLKVQNSYGESVGDKGIFYFSKEVADNLVFAYTFRDLNPEDIKELQWNILQIAYDVLVRIMRQFQKLGAWIR